MKHAIRPLLTLVFVIPAMLLVAVYIMFVIGMLYPFYKYGLPSFESTDTPIPKGRNVIELIYFLANTFVAIFTPIVLYLGVRQIRQGENARKASTYMEINKRYADDMITFAKNHMLLLESKYETDQIDGESISGYMDRILRDYAKSAPQELSEDPTRRTRHAKSLALILYLEEIGVLVSQGYLNAEDCFELIGGIIIHTERLLQDHIKHLRGEDPRILAHCLHLMEKARTYRGAQKTYNNGYYRI